MSSDAEKKTVESNRICFIKVIDCLQYLARPEQAMQGDTDDESNFIQLLKLIGKYEPLSLKWLEEDSYTSHDIQKEIIAIMANHVIQKIWYRKSGVAFSLLYVTSTQISVTRNV